MIFLQYHAERNIGKKMKQFKHKSDPSYKISQLRANLRLMVELGKIERETVQKIEKFLLLDYLEEQWNKPPLWKQMMRDLVNFMEDYQIHLYFPAFSEISIYWNNWGDSIHLHDLCSMFDVKAVKELPKVYRQQKLLNRQVKKTKDKLTKNELVELCKDARNFRFPGRERSEDKYLEDYILSLYDQLKATSYDSEKESLSRQIEWLEQLVVLRTRYQYSQKIRHGMDIRENLPKILKTFEEQLLVKYPNKEITLNDLRKEHSALKNISEDIRHTLFPEIVDYLEYEAQWKIIEQVYGKAHPLKR